LRFVLDRGETATFAAEKSADRGRRRERSNGTTDDGESGEVVDRDTIPDRMRGVSVRVRLSIMTQDDV